MSFFRTQDGCRLFYSLGNSNFSKPFVALLNGTCQTALHWTTIANSLKEDFTVLAYDARSQGRSSLGERPLSLALHVADLRNLLDSIGVSKAHLVGLSHGAWVAAKFASQFREISEKIVLCSVSDGWTCRGRLIRASWLTTLEREGIQAMIRAAIPMFFGERFLREKKDVLDQIVRALVERNTTDGVVAHLRAMGEYPPIARIASDLCGPVLVLSGSDDPLVPAEGARQLARLCRGRHEEIAGAGHSMPTEAPGVFVDILRNFLKES